MEHFWSVLGEVKGWLGEMERRYEECGPIGAHLERLLEQGPILQVGMVLGVEMIPHIIFIICSKSKLYCSI